MNNADSAKGKIFTSLSIGAGSVWFATHFGAGFASGTQLLSFYASKGWMAPLMILCTVAIQGVMFYIGLELARKYHTANYRELAEQVYQPWGKIGGVLFEITWLIAILLAISTCLSGAATVLNQLLGLNMLVGTALFAAFTIVVAAFGINVVRNCSTILTGLILVLVVLISVRGIANGRETLSEILTQRQIFTSWKDALINMLSYAGFQCASIAIAVCTSLGIRSKRESAGAAGAGVFLNGSLMILMTLMILAYMPGIMNNPETATMPTLHIVSQLDSPILLASCSVLLMLAYASSAVTEVFAVAQRFSPMVLKKMETTNPRRKAFIVCTAICVVCWVTSQLGLLWMVRYGYTYLGIVNIFLIIIPFITLGAYNLRRIRKETNLKQE